MCGIMGWYSFGNTLPDKDKITNMFSLLESRGRDASGYAFIKDNNLIVHKDAMKSSEFVKTNDWKDLVSSLFYDPAYQNENSRIRKE